MDFVKKFFCTTEFHVLYFMNGSFYILIEPLWLLDFMFCVWCVLLHDWFLFILMEPLWLSYFRFFVWCVFLHDWFLLYFDGTFMAIRFHVLCLMCFTPWLVPFIFRGNLLSRELSCSPVSTTLSLKPSLKSLRGSPCTICYLKFSLK